MRYQLRHLGFSLALASGLALGSAAHAGGDYHVITTDDAWEVGTGTDSQGNAYCSIQDQSKDQSFGLLLLIYPLGDDPSFEVHVFKDSWSVPGNADVPAKFNFSDGGSWSADGSAASDGSSVVDYSIDIKNMKDFLNDFAQSSSLDIVFTSGNEGTWTADLTGTSKATTDLLTCTQNLLGQNGGGGNTQPYNTPDNSQQGGDNTQPYTPPPSGAGSGGANGQQSL